MEPLSLRFAAIPGPLMAACIFAGVLIVHPTQPGAFPDIQSAVNVAKERDTILVKAGTYPAFEVVDTWLTIAADTGAAVSVTGGARVRDLESGKRVHLIGLTLTGSHAAPPATEHGLLLTSNQGPVRLTGCTLTGADSALPGFHDGGDGLRADASADVAISRSQLHGGLGSYGYVGGGPSSPGRGGAGVRALQSAVVVHDCTANGGFGRQGVSFALLVDGGDGGHGFHGESSVLFASRSTFTGGNGGNGYTSAPHTYGGAGGDGMRLEGPGSLARRISVTSFGAMGGHSQGGIVTFPDGPPGVAYAGDPALYVDLGPIGRSMSASTNPIRESTPAALTLTGQPGDRVGLFVSTSAASVFNPGWNGQQLFPFTPDPAFFFAGIVPASGTLSFSLPFPDLGSGVDARTFLIQPAFSSATHRLVLGTPIPMLVLDSAY